MLFFADAVCCWFQYMLLLVLDKYKQFAASHETRWIQSHASTSLGLMYLGSIMLVTWTSATIKQQINKFHKSVPHSRELPYQANFLQAWGSLLRATLSSKLWTVPHSRALPYHAPFYKPGPRSREPLDHAKYVQPGAVPPLSRELQLPFLPWPCYYLPIIIKPPLILPTPVAQSRHIFSAMAASPVVLHPKFEGAHKLSAGIASQQPFIATTWRYTNA